VDDALPRSVRASAICLPMKERTGIGPLRSIRECVAFVEHKCADTIPSIPWIAAMFGGREHLRFAFESREAVCVASHEHGKDLESHLAPQGCIQLDRLPSRWRRGASTS
jgi:hypothetical protein